MEIDWDKENNSSFSDKLSLLFLTLEFFILSLSSSTFNNSLLDLSKIILLFRRLTSFLSLLLLSKIILLLFLTSTILAVSFLLIL